MAPFVLPLLALAPVLAAALIGQAFTALNLDWHASLAKPAFHPPRWLFGPVWTLLYGMMACAFWRVLRAERRTPAAAEGSGRGEAIGLFLLQMVLNAVWPVAFFGLRSPAAGLAVILLLLLMVAATMRAFRAIDRPAAWLLAPYLAWLLFAAALDFAVWRLN